MISRGKNSGPRDSIGLVTVTTVLHLKHFYAKASDATVRADADSAGSRLSSALERTVSAFSIAGKALSLSTATSRSPDNDPLRRATHRLLSGK